MAIGAYGILLYAPYFYTLPECKDSLEKITRSENNVNYILYHTFYSFDHKKKEKKHKAK